jgi:leucyl aminopeptidase
VGKGITFDSGGLNIKAPGSMAGMKSDMAGGAAVLAAMTLFREFDIGWEVHGLIPCAENMPSGEAYKVGDVLKAKDGTWVEVTNTDAEGRLTMADALAFGKEVEPDIMVDMATLTGACMVALGKDTAAVMGTSRKRVEQWMEAARSAGESMWPLPLLESLEKDLKSQVADVKNAGSRWGGAITAGLFLKRFVGDVDWIHVDIAGPAFRDKGRPGQPAGGTGFGVRTLLSFLATVGS